MFATPPSISPRSFSAPPVAPMAYGFAGSSPYFAVQQNRARQRLLTFDADTRKTANPWSRTEMMLVARTLYAQYGPAMAVDTLFNLIGYLKPQACTGDPKFDAAAEEEFDGVATSPLIFDAAGEDDFYSFQPRMGLARAVDGDGFSIFTQTSTGSPRIAYRSGHLVKNPDDAGPGWYDGIRVNSDGFRMSYHFIDPSRPDFAKILPASAVFHHRETPPMGGVRSVTAFVHACNHFRDRIETIAAMKQAQKNAAMIGVTRAQDVAHGMTPSQFGIGSPTFQEPWMPPGSTTPTTGAEAAALPQLSFEEFIGNGVFSQIPLKTLQDDRPHPNGQEFLRELLREIAWGFKVPPHFLYFFDEPGGADIRIQIEILAKWVFRQHMVHLRPFCRRFWTYTIALGMQAGRLPQCKTDKWWRCTWRPQRSISADLGRMGRLAVELMQALMTCFADHYEEQGGDWEEKIDQIGKERRFIKDTEIKYDLEPGELTNALLRPGAAAQQQQESAEATAALAASVATLTEQVSSLTAQLRPAA